MTTQTKASRPKVAQHDETPSGITDHPFDPKGEWYTLCKHCNRAEAAHAETLVKHVIKYVSDDISVEEV